MAKALILLANRYEVEMDAPIGEGGMALVYRGWDTHAKRAVACKTLKPEFRNHPDHQLRFEQEATLISQFHHRNLVFVYEPHVRHESGTWVVMEFVDGPTLRELLDDEGVQSLEMVADILDQLADVFDVIHGDGLVHLDMKPQNVMIQHSAIESRGRSSYSGLHDDDVVKLIDFGLAQPGGQEQRRLDGKPFGTVAYVAPEQATAGGVVTPETDVYAIGCVVYEMLAGRPPFVADADAGNTHEQILHMHRTRLPVTPSVVTAGRLPGWVDTVVIGALEKDPERRFGSVASFARNFRFSLEGHAPAYDAGAVDTGAMEVKPSRPLWITRVYRAGALRARRSPRLRRVAWKFTAMFAVAMLLFIVLSTLAGSPPLFLDQFQQDRWDRVTTVAQGDSFYVRTGPGTDMPVVDLLGPGTRVEVVGGPEEASGHTWVLITCDCRAAQGGWIAEDALESPEWTGWMSWMNTVDDTTEWLRDTAGDVDSTVRGWLP